MTSSTKTEVGLRNMWHYCERRTESRRQLTCTENFMKFGRLIFTTPC